MFSVFFVLCVWLCVDVWIVLLFPHVDFCNDVFCLLCFVVLLFGCCDVLFLFVLMPYVLVQCVFVYLMFLF